MNLNATCYKTTNLAKINPMLVLNNMSYPEWISIVQFVRNTSFIHYQEELIISQRDVTLNWIIMPNSMIIIIICINFVILNTVVLFVSGCKKIMIVTC